MIKYAAPPGYRRRKPPGRPRIGPYTGVIDEIPEDDLNVPKKRRHTAKRIYERLRDERGFEGKYTIVKDYARERRRTTREMFVPLSHPAGHAQCDFGEAWAVIDGVKRKIHFFVLSLPHSDGIFVKAYPAETTEAFCAGGYHQDPQAALLLPPRTAHPQGASPHFASSPALALGNPVQSRLG